MPLDDIDPEILQFVDRYMDQFVTWDVLVFFHENPDIERKPSGVAMDIGRKLSLVEPCLASLLDRGILAREPDEARRADLPVCPPARFQRRHGRLPLGDPRPNDANGHSEQGPPEGGPPPLGVKPFCLPGNISSMCSAH